MAGFSGLIAGRSGAGPKYIFQTYAILAHGQTAMQLPQEASRSYSSSFSSNPLRISQNIKETGLTF